MKGGGGVRIGGGIGEVWVFGMKAGLVYEWRLDGWARDFQFEAERYKLDPLLVRGRDVTLKLETRDGYYISAKGHIWTEPVIDGRIHDAIVVKGKDMSWQHERSVAALTGI